MKGGRKEERGERKRRKDRLSYLKILYGTVSCLDLVLLVCVTKECNKSREKKENDVSNSWNNTQNKVNFRDTRQLSQIHPGASG